MTEPTGYGSGTVDAGGLGGAQAAGLFVVGTLLWTALVGLSVSVMTGVSDGATPMSGAVLAAIASVQTGGLVMLAVLLSRAQGLRLVTTLGLSPWSWHGGLFATLAGMAIALVGGWFAQALVSRYPLFDPGHLEQVAVLLGSGSALSRIAMYLLVLVFAPLLEELIFRGFLWDALGRFLPRSLVWLLTSLLFAAYHMDPLQVVSVLPTSLVIGWFRLSSGSVGPAVLCHFAHNALGLLLIAWMGLDAGGELSGGGLAGLCLLVIVCGTCVHLFRSVESPGSDQQAPEALG